MRWEQFARSLIDRRARGSLEATDIDNSAPARHSSSPATTLVFETLEPRLLLAADPLGITAGYAFNESSGTTTADASGHGLTGTLTSGAMFTTAGKNGNALSLDGVNDYVNLANPTLLRLTGSITISAWIYATSNPIDDAAIVSKRTAAGVGFQLDTTIDTGPRTIGFKLTNSSGGQMLRYGATTLQLNTWYYITGVYNAASQTLDVYLNGQLDNGVLQGTITSSQQNSSANVNIGRRAGGSGFEFAGRIDDVRIADHALTADQIRTDMATPLGSITDTTVPSTPTGLTATPASATQVNLSWTASTDNIGVTGYQIFRGGTLLTTVTTTSYSNTGLTPNTAYQYQVRAVDAAGNQSGLSTAASATTPADTTAPSTPTGLTATPASTTQVNLSWAASTDNVGVTGYQIFRDGTLLTTVSTTSYSNTGLTPNTTYQYQVGAVDAAGNQSGLSTAASATTPGPDAIAPSVTLTAPVVPVGSSSVTVTGSVTVSATASDNTGVQGVQFLLDNVLLADDTTSPYSTSWNTTTASNGQHTLAARARDAAGNASTASITVIVDNQAPTGSVVINSGAAATNSTAVTLTLAAADALGAVSQMRFSNTGTTFSTAENYATSKAWTLSSGTGTKTVYVQFKDAAGNWSGSFTDTIVLDTTAPTITATTATNITTNSAQVAWTTNEAATSRVEYGTTTSYGSSSPLDSTLVTSHAVTLSGLLANTTYNYRVRSIDAAGNERIGPNATFKTTVAGAPQVVINSPVNNAQVSGIITVTADATDDTGVAGVSFFVDGVARGVQDTTDPYAFTWDTRGESNGAHALTAQVRDISGNAATSAPVTVNVANNTNNFQNEILATGFNLPTVIKFLPDGRMLVGELAGKIKVLPPPYTTPDAALFLQITNIGSAGVQQGIFDIALDPNFTTNHFYYVFYTLGTPNRDRLSRFTANSTLTGTIAGSEVVLYQDPEDANAEHHGGSINFGNDGKIYITTGEHFDAAEAQDLTKPRGKILRLNPDGTVPTDNPFYDGSGPNYDAIWALGLRNPYRAYYDAPTGRLIIGDVGGNDYSTAIEEVDIGARGANYGWPDVEAPNGNPAYTAPAYYYAHNGRDAAITGGFVYHGTQFPSSYQGVYFFADYTQNWIRYLTFDANGTVTGAHNFEPMDGTVDGPYGDIVYMTQGPEGALYYVDLGYSDISGQFGVSKIRRISYLQSDLPPVVSASANPSEGPNPLAVNFSSAGSSDPEGKPLTYGWVFGDGGTSTDPNPSHTYTNAGQYQARLTVSDGVNSSLSPPLSIMAGNRPTVAITSPTASSPLFRAGDVISFSGDATDIEAGGALPASAFTWNIDFLHEGHVHPGTPITGVKSGTFAIPTSGHDFSGFTRYRITLTVTDSDGLQSSTSVIIFPDKVNLTFDTAPGGLTIYLDGIAHAAPFVYDTLIGFNHTVEARNQTVGANTYNFSSWSDGGTQQHTLVVPGTAQSYTASYSVVSTPVPIAFVQVNAATPQTNQTSVAVTYTSAQVAGDTNILAIGWNNATSNITSVTDSAGNVYELAAPTARGSGISQAIYYAKNIKAAAAGANTVTVTFNTATPYVDIRATEYSGLDPINPLDATASASGSSSSASSGSVTTTAARELIFGAGITIGGFGAAGTNFTSRILTSPDLDIAEDRFVTTAGSYNATASLTGSAAWVMQVVAFKAASQVA